MSIRTLLFSTALTVSALAIVTPSAFAQDTLQLGELEGVASQITGRPVKHYTVAMTLAELETRLRSHPSLEALSFSAEADRYRAEGALGLPDPTVSMGLNNFPIFSPSFTEYLPTHKYIGVRQSLPNASKRKASSLKSLRSADRTELETEMQYARLKAELLTLLIEKEAINHLRGLARDREAKYQELTGIVEIEINAGRPTVFRLAEVEVERTEVAQTLSKLDGREARINARFIDLVSVVPDTSVPSIAPQYWSRNALAFYGVRVADAAVGVQDAEVQKAQADFKPDWGFNFTYQQRESGQGAPRSNFDGDDWISGGVSVTVPLWSQKRQEPNLRAAKSDKSAAMARRMAVARQLISDWERLKARRDVAVENITIIEKKIMAFEDQIASKLVNYEAGLGDYSPILDGEIAILSLKSQIITEAAMRDSMAANMNSLLVGE